MENIQFSNNSAEYHNEHGIIKVLDSNITVAQSHFVDNLGGCFHVMNSCLQIQSCQFEHNQIRQAIEDGEIKSITMNFSRSCGSVVLASMSRVSITESTFLSNYADIGAVLYMTNESQATVSSPQFERNSANAGAVMLAKGTEGNITNDHSIVGNQSENVSTGSVLVESSNGSSDEFDTFLPQTIEHDSINTTIQEQVQTRNKKILTAKSDRTSKKSHGQGTSRDDDLLTWRHVLGLPPPITMFLFC